MADLNLGKDQGILFFKDLFKSFYGVIPQELIHSSHVVPWCEYKGVYYKSNIILTLDVNLDETIFRKIKTKKNNYRSVIKIPYFKVSMIYITLQ